MFRRHRHVKLGNDSVTCCANLRGMSTPRLRLPSTVIALGVTSLLADVSSEMVVPVLPLLLTTVLGAGALQLAAIEGFGNTAAALLRLVSGRISDRVARRKPLVLLGYGATALTRPLLAIAPTWGWVLGCRLLDRVGKGIRGAPRDALIADVTVEAQRGRAYGLHRAMDHLGATIGPLCAAAALAAGLDPRTIILLAFLPAALAMLALWGGVKESSRETAAATTTPQPLSPGSRADLARLLGPLAIKTLGAPAEMLLLLKLTQENLAPTSVAVGFALYNAVQAGTTWLAGGWADRVAPRRVAWAGWVLQAVLLWLFAEAADTRIVCVAWLVYAGAAGICEPAEKKLVAAIAPAHARGTMFGWYNLTIGLTALPGGLLLGAIWDAAGARQALDLASLLLALAAAALFFLSRRRGAGKLPASP